VIAAQTIYARGTRRLHADAGLCGDARHQPGHAQGPTTVKDFTAIGMIGATPTCWSSQPAGQDGQGIHRLYEEELGQVSYGSAGQGSLTHLTMELFKQQIDPFMVHIPHRVAPAFTDLIGGQTQVGVLPPSPPSHPPPRPATVTAFDRSNGRVQGFLMRSSGNGVVSWQACLCPSSHLDLPGHWCSGP
jgi:hypothetical protein